jgi:hypothetical protein
VLTTKTQLEIKFGDFSGTCVTALGHIDESSPNRRKKQKVAIHRSNKMFKVDYMLWS